MKEKQKNKTHPVEQCPHSLEELDQAWNGDEIVITYECKKCKRRVIEFYRLEKSIELDEQGNQICEYY